MANWSRLGGRVTENYLGQPLGNCQDPDEPYDKSQGTKNRDGVKIGGRGAQGGGSKSTPQAQSRGKATIGSTAPKSPQKLRG